MTRIGTALGRYRVVRAVDVSAVLDSVDHYCHLVLQDLVDDAVVATAGGSQALKFVHQRFADPLGILSHRAEDGGKGCISNLVGQAVEMPQARGRDLDLVHGAASDVIAQS